jgi:hypothetical protein
MYRTLVRGFTVAFALSLTGALAGCTATTPDDPGASSIAELGARAPDSTGRGPLATTDAEYRFEASVDPDILSDRKTEVWAQVYRPATLNANEKHPLLVFLHGNHATCGRGSNPRVDDNTQYSTQGTCPSGYVVTPNHLGYAYAAERLASWGYIVVSINANRGITASGGVSGDLGLNLARGRLVLKHLQHLGQWNAQAGSTPSSLGVDLAGKIDFSQVGMMGHSRGGEGVRAAYTQYHDQGSPWPARIASPLDVRAIFEIGPVDGQTSRQLNALNTAWNVLLPMCDGDVSNLQGMKPFDRMLAAAADEVRPTPKAMFAVWGANHNYYNTEWQTSDSDGCRGSGHAAMFQSGQVGSSSQQATGLHGLMGFFRAHVGANAETGLNNMYDPMYQVPESLEAITHIERAYADAALAANVKVLENFTKPAGTSLSGQPTVAQNVTVTHGSVSEHDAVLKAANIKWTSASSDNYFEVPFAAVDASTMKTIDFRLSRQSSNPVSTGPMNFSVRLVNADGSMSAPLKLSDYLGVAPFGGHTVLETARLPLADFPNANLASVRGVRFVFDDTATGALFLTSIRLSRAALENRSIDVTAGTFRPLDTPGSSHTTTTITTGNVLGGMRATISNEIEVDLQSQFAFPVADDLPRLRIGNKDILISRFADDGDTHHIFFKIAPQELAALPDGSAMKVRYGEDVARYEWDFGTFEKSAIQR